MAWMEKLMMQVALVDQVTKPLAGINAQMDKVSKAGRQGWSSMAMGATTVAAGGMAIQSALGPAIEMDRALAEVASLDVQKEVLGALGREALKLSIQYGESATEIVRSSYDIQSAIAGLEGNELPAFTRASTTLAKATKADTATITNYMGTMYGIFEQQAKQMGKANWVEDVAGKTALAMQLLGEDGQPDTLTPRYLAVPLPVQFGGPEQGLMQFPLEGTLVELGFAFGRADRPFIRTVLGTGWPLPDIAPGEQLQQQRAEVFSRTDTVGNLSRHTDRRLHDRALQMHHQSDDYLGEHGQHRLQVAQHSTEEVGGFKLIEALGAIELLAGDDLTLGCLGNLSQTTAGDLVEVVGQLRRSVTAELQHFEAPHSWMGTEGVNIFRLLLQLMNVVEQLAATTASHTHPGSLPPGQASTFSNQSKQAGQLATALSPIIE